MGPRETGRGIGRHREAISFRRLTVRGPEKWAKIAGEVERSGRVLFFKVGEITTCLLMNAQLIERAELKAFYKTPAAPVALCV